MLAKNYPIVGMKLSDVLKDPNTTVYQTVQPIDGSEVREIEILTIDTAIIKDVEIIRYNIVVVEDNCIVLYLEEEIIDIRVVIQ